MLRIIAGILGGLVLANLIVFAVEWLAVALFPAAAAMPAGSDSAEWEAYISGLPVIVLCVVIAGWVLGAVGGSFVAARIAARALWPGWIAGGLFLLVVIANFVQIRHPGWMLVGLPLVVGAGWLGARLGARGTPTAAWSV